MPNKTIYVAEEDLPLLEQAQALTGGNLSAAVGQALRGFVDTAKARDAGFEEVTVRVGPAGAKRLKRFRGYEVARWQTPRADSRQVEVFTVYHTQGGRFAVHWRKGPNWDWWSDPRMWKDMWAEHGPIHHKVHNLRHQAAEWGFFGHSSEETLKVYDDMEALKEDIPPELAQIVAEADREPRMEVLDI